MLTCSQKAQNPRKPAASKGEASIFVEADDPWEIDTDPMITMTIDPVKERKFKFPFEDPRTLKNFRAASTTTTTTTM